MESICKNDELSLVIKTRRLIISLWEIADILLL